VSVVPISRAFEQRVGQARERIAGMRVEDRRAFEQAAAHLTEVGYVDGGVDFWADVWSVTRTNASRRLRRLDGVAWRWLPTQGGAGSRLALLPARQNAPAKNESNFASRVREREPKVFNRKSEEQNPRAKPCPRSSLTRRPRPAAWISLEELIEKTDERTLAEAREIVDVLDCADERTLRTVLVVLDRGDLGVPELWYAFDRLVAHQREVENDAAYLVATLQNIAAGYGWVPDSYYETSAA
jgi:hypothetical protein